MPHSFHRTPRLRPSNWGAAPAFRQATFGRASGATLLGALMAVSVGCSDGTIGVPPGSQSLSPGGSATTSTSAGAAVTSAGDAQVAGTGATTGAVGTSAGAPVVGEATTGAVATTAAVAGEATTGAVVTGAATTGVATTGVVVEVPAGTGVLEDLSGCIAPAGLGRPNSIAASVALLNALPKPTSPACYLAALERPLGVIATSSTRSVQPAGGDLSPRVFILQDNLVTSVVIAGDAASLIEYGEFVTPVATIKGELAFPLAASIDVNEPFDEVSRRNGGTRCGPCHGIELVPKTTAYQGAFYSAAFKPNDGTRQNDIVPLETLLVEWGICDASFEPTRCSMLEALFSRGDVVRQDFPADVSTFQRGPDTIIDEDGNVITIIEDDTTTVTSDGTVTTTGSIDPTTTTSTTGG